MSRIRLWLLALVVLVAPPAYAQIAGHPIELSGQAGISKPDVRTHSEMGPAYGGSLGWRWQPWMTLEGYAVWAPSTADTTPGQDLNFSTAGLDLRWNMRPGESRVVPFLLTGFGYGLSHTTGTPPEKLERGAPTIGIGALFNVINQRAYLRLQVRDVFFRDRESEEFSNDFAVTAGLHYVFGGKVRDTDLDGVRDWLDQCPSTPIGAAVDAKGCPMDTDGDKVLDGLDKCPGTPVGCTVDKNGCPKDSDGDGVCDGVDQCADTPKGATVDTKGCPKDSDGDGVLDGIDTCEGTLQGCQADEKGCPKDSDGDGVCDGLDKCPDTAAGLKVDKDGCPVEVMERETELLDTGMIRIENINFETGKAVLLPESFPTLDAVGQVLSKWPQLMIEIGGHTDSRGSATANQKLSQARAKAVQSYLAQKYPTLLADQFRVKGYGESKPLVKNDSDLNMAHNRRVEFTVLNQDVLKREVESRRLLKEGESAPADTTKK